MRGQQLEPDYDAQECDDPKEYEAMREAERANDFAPNAGDATTAKVKLLTSAMKWVCQAKSKTNKRDKDYFVQAVFTTSGNTVILTYDVGTAPMKPGFMAGLIVEVFGRNIEISKDEKNPEKKVAVIFGAEVIIPRRPEPIAAKPKVKTLEEKPKLDAVAQMRASAAMELRREMNTLKREIEFDDTREDALKARVLELTMKLARLERGEDSPAPAEELKKLIAAQIADDTDTAGDIIDQTADDADSDAETLDHDADGAELERSTEPWTESSLPIGATVDADCWDCPARLGATCTRQACMMN